MAANGAAYFDLSSTPANVNTGSNNVQVFADVMGSPSNNFQFEILNSYDVLAVDSQYNVPISVTLTAGADAQVTIQQGQITVTQDSGDPDRQHRGRASPASRWPSLTSTRRRGGQGRIPRLQACLHERSDDDQLHTLSQFVRNVSLVDDAGGQVGTTINTPPSGNTCAQAASANGYTSATDGTLTNATVNYEDCFGTSGSPINYIVPANTTRVLSLKADIQSLTSPATFGTVTASLLSESGKSNLQGLTSSQSADSAGTTGSALSLQSSLLTVTKNSAYGNQTVTPNSTNVHIGSYSFTASSASGIQINTVGIKVAKNGSGSNDFQNLKVMIGGTQFGTTQGVVADASTYTFSGSPFTVPAGQTTYVDVYADILSGATSTSPSTSLSGCSGTSVVSYSAVSCPSTATDGQNVTISSGGATVTEGLDSSAPAASLLVMGSTGNALGAFRFTETSNVENVKITDIVVAQNTTSSAASGYSNVTLWNGSTAVGTSGGASSTATGYAYKFHFATPPVIPQNGTLVLTLKGDVASYTSGGATDNSTSTFSVATSTVTALGASSNIASTLSGSATGNTMTVLRTTITPTAVAVGTASGRVKSSVDNIANITVSANNAGSAMLNTLAITFSGNAISSTATSSFVLRDANNVDVTTGSSFSAAYSGTACTTSTGCTETWTFSSSTNPLVISAGSSYTFTLQTNDTGFNSATGNNSVSLSATLQNTTSTTYYDNSTASGTIISLPTTMVPMNVTNITFAAGT